MGMNADGQPLSRLRDIMGARILDAGGNLDCPPKFIVPHARFG